MFINAYSYKYHELLERGMPLFVAYEIVKRRQMIVNKKAFNILLSRYRDTGSNGISEAHPPATNSLFGTRLSDEEAHREFVCGLSGRRLNPLRDSLILVEDKIEKQGCISISDRSYRVFDREAALKTLSFSQRNPARSAPYLRTFQVFPESWPRVAPVVIQGSELSRWHKEHSYDAIKCAGSVKV